MTRFNAALLLCLCPLAASAQASAPSQPRLVIQTPPELGTWALDPNGDLAVLQGTTSVSIYSLQARALVGRIPGRFYGMGAVVSASRWLLLEDSGETVLADLREEKVLHPFASASGIEFKSVVLARDVPQGAAIVTRQSSGGEPSEASTPPLRGYAQPEQRVLRMFSVGETISPNGAWPVPDACEALAISPDARVAVAWCGSELLVAERGRKALRAVAPGQPLGEAPQSSALSIDARARTLEARWGDGRLLSIDLRSGGVGENAAPAVASGEDALVDPQRGIVLRREGDHVELFAKSGAKLGRIGGDLRVAREVAYDAKRDRLFAAVAGEYEFRSSWREVDLAEASTRPATTEGEDAPAAELLRASDFQELTLYDVRAPEKKLTVSGLEKPKETKPLRRLDGAHVLVSEGGRLGVLDLQARRIAYWVPRAPPSKLTAAAFDATARVLWIVDETARVESWDVAKDRRVAVVETGLKPDQYGNDAINSVVPLPTGSLLLGGGAGLSLLDGDSPVRALKQGWVDQVVLSPDGRRVTFRDTLATTRLCGIDDVIAGRFAPCATFEGSDAMFLRGGRELLVRGPSSLELYEASTARRIASIYFGPDGSSLIATPGGQYKADVGALRLAVVSHRLRARHLDEVDVHFNSPSAVLAALGRATPDRIAEWRAIEERRRERVGVRPTPFDDREDAIRVRLPGAPPVWTADSSLSVRVRIEHAAPPVRIQARVNGVPIGGRRGVPARGKGAAFVESVSLPLAPGENRVTVTATDASGSEAFGESFLVTSTAPRKPGRIFFLGIGVSKYRDAARSLQYAAKDVSDVARALDDLSVHTAKVKLLLDDEATLENIRAARAFLEQASFGDLAIVYLAGHGLLDEHGDYYFGAHAIDFDHPAKGGLSFAQLEALVDGLEAGNKVLFIDSCHSGEGGSWTKVAAAEGARGVVTARGAGVEDDSDATSGEETDLRELEATFVDLRQGTGATVIAAAGRAEYAYETAGTSNGLFTHAVLATLLEGEGVNPEGELRVPDVLQKVRQRVATLSHGRQTPQIRNANAAFEQPLLRSRPAAAVFTPREKLSISEAVLSRDGSRLALLGEDAMTVVALPRGTRVSTTPLPNGLCQRTGCRLTPAAHADEFYLYDLPKLFVLNARARSIKPLSATELWSPVFSSDGQHVAACNGAELILIDTSKRSDRRIPVSRCLPGYERSTRRFVNLELEAAAFVDPQSGAVGRRPLPDAVKSPAWFTPHLSDDGRVAFSQAGTKLSVFDLLEGTVQDVELRASVDSFALRTAAGTLLRSSVLGGLPPLTLLGVDGAVLQQWNVYDHSAVTRGDQVIVPASPDMQVDDVSYRSNTDRSFFRVFDLDDGRPLGWFSAPGWPLRVVPGEGDELYLVNEQSGAISRVSFPRVSRAP